jgi:hypothetical protein
MEEGDLAWENMFRVRCSSDDSGYWQRQGCRRFGANQGTGRKQRNAATLFGGIGVGGRMWVWMPMIRGGCGEFRVHVPVVQPVV